jgi:ABC-type amino acid transport system permease subunit
MPLLVLILMFFYVVANALGIQDRLLVGVVVLSLFAGAYIAEIIEPELKAWRRNWKAHAPLGDCGTNVSIRHISRALRQILPPWQGSSLPSLRTLRFSQSLDSPNSLTQRSRLIQPPIAPWKATFPSPSAI